MARSAARKAGTFRNPEVSLQGFLGLDRDAVPLQVMDHPLDQGVVLRQGRLARADKYHRDCVGVFEQRKCVVYCSRVASRVPSHATSTRLPTVSKLPAYGTTRTGRPVAMTISSGQIRSTGFPATARPGWSDRRASQDR